MSQNNPDVNDLIEQANETLSDSKDRTRGKSKYIRKALVKVGRMSPKEFAAYEPKDMFEAMAMNIIGMAANGSKASAVSAVKEIKDALGENVKASSNAKETTDKPEFHIGLPRPDRTQVANA
jgi:hypothetical protein